MGCQAGGVCQDQQQSLVCWEFHLHLSQPSLGREGSLVCCHCEPPGKLRKSPALPATALGFRLELYFLWQPCVCTFLPLPPLCHCSLAPSCLCLLWAPHLNYYSCSPRPSGMQRLWKHSLQGHIPLSQGHMPQACQ
jgi:hypothetical protein